MKRTGQKNMFLPFFSPMAGAAAAVADMWKSKCKESQVVLLCARRGELNRTGFEDGVI